MISLIQVKRSFRISKDKEYVVFNLTNRYYSICDEEYNFIEYKKVYKKENRLL